MSGVNLYQAGLLQAAPITVPSVSRSGLHNPSGPGWAPTCQVPPAGGKERGFVAIDAPVGCRGNCERNWLLAAGLFLKNCALGTERGGRTGSAVCARLAETQMSVATKARVRWMIAGQTL